MKLSINSVPVQRKFALLCAYALLSLGALGQAKIDSSNVTTLRIDPQTAHGAKVSEVFDDVKFIPLETTKESLFGRINSLKVVKNQFVIFDYDTRAVLIFSREGKFKGKIDASKIPKDDADKSKNEFYGYKIVDDNKDSVISIFAGKYHHYFDLTGKFIKKIPRKDLQLFEQFQFADKETTVRPFFVKKTGKDSTYYELAVLRKKDTLTYLPFSMDRYQKDDFWDGAKFYDYDGKNEMFFVNLYDYNIHKITPSGLALTYRIIFPANNSLPKDWMTNPSYVKKRSEYFQRNQKVFYSLNNTYPVGDFLFMQMRSYSWDKETKKAIIYNLKTTEVTSLQDIEPDSASYFLPVTDAGSYHDFLSNGFLLYKDDYFYTSYSSLAMFAFKSQMGDRNKKFPPLLEDYFKTQDRKSNPVIIQLKPKKH